MIIMAATVTVTSISEGFNTTYNVSAQNQGTDNDISVTRLGAGCYEIVFSPPFKVAPTVVVTPFNNDATMSATPTTTTVRIYIRHVREWAVDCSFNVMIVGQR